MNLSIFSPVKRIKKPRRQKDRFDRYVDLIESFAPREHRPEREVYYYNYKMIASYGSALLALLETLSQFKQFKRDPKNHSSDLFKKFKRFYDPQNTLSLKEAVLNKKLIIRFENIFTIFYGIKKPDSNKTREWLEDLFED